MALKKEQLGSISTAHGVAVYSRDQALVKSIADALKHSADKRNSRDYIVIHQTSIASIDNVCTTSVLDIDMVGASVSGVKEGVAKIKGKQPNHPIFLVGDKVPLTDVMQDPAVKSDVTRIFAKPMLGPKIMMALNMVMDSAASEQAVTQSEQSSKLLRVLVGGLIFIALGFVGWYLNSQQDARESHVPTVVDAPVVDEPVGLPPQREPEATTAISDVIEEAGESGDLAVVQEQTEKTESVVNSIDQSLDVPKSTVNQEVELFSVKSQTLLDQARAALKKGYIVGPENVNALHYYRQALEIDPYNDLAQTRKQTLVSELQSELALAMEQSKYGRSKSIIKVIIELDPFNDDIELMQTALQRRFK